MDPVGRECVVDANAGTGEPAAVVDAILDERGGDLPEVAGALDALRVAPGGGEQRHQDRHQRGDDADHDQ